jgi:hypothetical protein
MAASSHELLIMEYEGTTLLWKSEYVHLCITQYNVPEDWNFQLYK